jgi:hypothetical protein
MEQMFDLQKFDLHVLFVIKMSILFGKPFSLDYLLSVIIKR